MFDLASPSLLGNPYPAYAKMREHSPVCQVEPGPMWAVTTYADVKFALRNYQLFSSSGVKSIIQADWLRDECKRSLFTATEDPPLQTKHNAILNKIFNKSSLDALIPMMEQTAQQLVKDIEKGTQIDFLDKFAHPFVGKIIAHITGLDDYQSIGDMRHWTDILETMTPSSPEPDRVLELENSILCQQQFFRAVIDDRKKNPRDDFASHLVNSSVDGNSLTDSELCNALDLMVQAGYLTTVHLLSSVIIQLSRQPDLLQLLINTPQHRPAFIEEVLRLHSPSLCTMRQTTQAVTLSNVEIPEDSLVILLLASANRDHTVFSNPDEIDLFRDNLKDHLAFGHGAHICIGLALARQEVKIALNALLSSFDKFSCPADHELRWCKSFTMRGLKTLPVHFW